MRFISLLLPFFSFLDLSKSRLVLLVCPDMISMDDLEILSHFARY